MTEEIEGAILQRDKKTYAIVPRTPVGLLTPDDLEQIAKVARKYAIPIIKITSGQRFALIGFERDQLDDAWADLGLDVGKATELCLHYVQACPGIETCKFGVQDSLELGKRLEQLFAGIAMPAKVKIGVSGCHICCAESMVRDIGIFAKKTGWNFVVGGSSAQHPRIGNLIRKKLTEEEAMGLTKKTIEIYQEGAEKGERLARFIERIGIERFEELLSEKEK